MLEGTEAYGALREALYAYAESKSFSLKRGTDTTSQDTEKLLDTIEKLKHEFELTKFAKADKKKHRFAKDGFTYRTAYFEDYNGEYYKVTISIGHNGDVATVYNVGKIKKDSLPNGNIKTVLSGSKPNSESFLDSIAPLPENVNDFKENKTPGLSNTALNGLLRADQVSYTDSIAPLPENVNTKFSVSPEGEQFAPVGNYSTPLNETALDIAPVAEGVAKTETVAENATTTDDNNVPAEQTVDKKISAKLQNLQTELENNKKLRDESNADFDSEISRLQAEYDAKKERFFSRGSRRYILLHTLLQCFTTRN